MAKIGDFELLELLGHGAMGAVYRAVDPAIGRMVAIKVIRLTGNGDLEEAAFLKDRLFKEAKAAGGLSHPGIVTVYQLGAQDDQAYIVMEYIDGTTLESRLASKTPADPRLMARVLRDVASALDYAHERGIVHRDIKPANVMIAGPEGSVGAVKITDFGIAKTLIGHTRTQTGRVLGTPYYMSPEQVRGMPLDGRSDQFALGVIAYQMLTGRRPFDGEHITSIWYQIVHIAPPLLANVNPTLSSAVSRVLSRALEKDAAKRFPTCIEFADALVHACEHGEVTARVKSKSSTPAPAPKRKPIPIARWRLSAATYLRQSTSAFAAIAAFVLIISAICVLRPGFAEERTKDIAVPRQSGSSPVVIRSAALDEEEQSKNRIQTPATGRIVWTGKAGEGMLLKFENGLASMGKMFGEFPGEPVEVRVFPAERISNHLKVFTSDHRYVRPVLASTRAGSALFSWDPRRITDIAVWEKPNPANRWGKLVLRVNSDQLTACVIEWKKLK